MWIVYMFTIVFYIMYYYYVHYIAIPSSDSLDIDTKNFLIVPYVELLLRIV